MAYAWVLWFSFRRYSAYRLAALGEAVSNTVFGFVRGYVLLALWQATPGLGGYTATDAITFSFLTQAMIGPVQIFGGMELTQRIRTGDVSIDLHRPADLQLWWLADDLGRALYTVIGRGTIPMFAGWLAFGILFPPAERWPAFLLSLLLAVVLGFSIRYVISILVFWLTDSRALDSVAIVCSLFLSGMILPLVAFPGPFQTAVRALPWSGLIQVPADVYLGRSPDLLGSFAFQAGWAAVLLLAGRLLTRAAHRKLVIQGG
ncbi:ABC transporter permease [Actinocorallia longicatena]|uniref:ABC-2 family transporter protein n=1 Tax=Actinocorallia longicatena TaxID=111803 RepID=A0ABP6Q7E0_9ACTN